MALEIRVSNLLPLISFATRQGGAMQEDMTEVQGDVAALQSEKADKVTTITPSGLATGGGSLAANRTIDVPKATGAEAAAGVVDTKAVTPLALKTPLDTLTALVANVDAKFADVARGIAEDSMSFSAWVAAHPEITDAALYEPQDIRTLFQDQAGTIPVTAPGQTVKRMKNKLSTTGRHDMIYSSLTVNATYQVDAEGVGYIDFPATSVLASDPFFTVTDPFYWIVASKRSDGLTNSILAGMGQDNGDAIILYQPNQSVVGRYISLARTGTTSMTITAPYKMDLPEQLHIFDALVRENFLSAWVDGRLTPKRLNIDDELFAYTSTGGSNELFLWNHPSSVGIQRDRLDADWPHGTTFTNSRFVINHTNVAPSNPVGSASDQGFYGAFGCSGAAPDDEDRGRMFDFWRKRTRMSVLDESDYDLFAFVGDSNMHGTTEVGASETYKLAELPLRTDGAIYHMHGMLSPIYAGNQHMAPNQGSLGGSMLGPFAKAYYAITGKRALVLGFGYSTRGLVRPTGASYPSVFTADGFNVDRMVRMTRRAIDHIQNELGRKVEFRGIVSGLGAYDAGVTGATTVGMYVPVIQEFVTRLRSKYGIPNLPYFMVSVDSNTAMETEYKVIRDSQIAAANPANNIFLACPYQDFMDIVTGTRWPDEMMAAIPHWNQRAQNVAGQVTGEFCGNLFKEPEEAARSLPETLPSFPETPPEL